ncbi:MAG: alginate lyase family protein [Planctomycetota bacterium]|nr:alginate lyase family protein [Planctomycetota bacterium]
MSPTRIPAPPRPVVSDFVIPTRAEFLRTLDLTAPALQSTRDALNRGDVDAAGRAFIAHFRRRPMESPLLPDWSATPRDPARKNKIADDCLRGKLWDGYNVYDIPASGIDWYDCPLFCLPRFPVFPHLLEAWHDSGDPRYLRFIVDHSLEYIRAYPIEKFAGRNSLDDMRSHYHVGPPTWWCLNPNRLDEWTAALAAIRTSPLVTDEELLTILHRMTQEIRYLLTQVPYWVGEAHNVACFIIRVMGRLFTVMADFADAPTWRRLAAVWLKDYLESAFYPDGQFKELTTGYGTACVEHVAITAHALRDEPESQGYRAPLRQMLMAVAAQCGPSGRIHSFGDCRTLRLDQMSLVPLAQWLGDPWLSAIIDYSDRLKPVPYGVPGPPGTPADASAATQLANGPTPAPPFLHWPPIGSEVWGGYYTMRSDWSPQARFLMADGGPWGTTHQHMDRLSFVLSAHGADFLADPSCTLYANNEPDARLSTMHAGFVHNTITVDGIDEYVRTMDDCEAKEPIHNRWEHGPGWSLFAGSYDFSPLKPLRWERRILFVDGRYWLVQDVLTEAPPEGVTTIGPVMRKIEQNFQFEPEIALEVKADRATAVAANGARLIVLPLEGGLAPHRLFAQEEAHPTCSTQYGAYGKPGELPHGRGWVARWTNHIIPAPALTFIGEVQLPHVTTLAFIPLAPGEAETALPKITSREERGGRVWRLPTGTGVGAVEVLASVEEFLVVSGE